MAETDVQEEEGSPPNTPPERKEVQGKKEGRPAFQGSTLLITGEPGTGKTTLLRRALASFSGPAGGFYTQEIRSGGTRLGFRLETLDGEQATLAHVDFKSPHRVSKYGVDAASLERVGVAALKRAREQGGLVVVDEIGKMELLSQVFREVVEEAIREGRVLGTIMQAPHPWADRIRALPQVRLLTLHRGNFERTLEEVQSWLEAR